MAIEQASGNLSLLLSSNTALAILVLGGAYYLATAIYSATLHPLAGIPGPRLSSWTRIPYWIHVFLSDIVEWQHKLHTQYGPVVRFGPTDVSYIGIQAWKDVHGQEKGRENGKALEFHLPNVNGVPSLIAAEQDDHNRVRRLFSPAFSERSLRSQEPLFQKYVKLLMSKLHELGADETPIEITRLLNFTTFDVMAELCFGHSLDLLVNNKLDPWVSSIFENLKAVPVLQFIQYYPIINIPFWRFQPKSILEQRKKHCGFSADRVNERLRLGSDKPDIWNLALSAAEQGNGLSLKEMHSNAEIFMLAGTETTATLLSGATYLLCTNPDKFRLLKDELRSFSSATDLSFDNLVNLKYLNAVLRETLRLYPPVPVGVPRVVPEGGSVILGRWVPPETRVSIPHYASYHSAAHFKDSEAFRPERFLGDSLYNNDVRDALQPFSFGPRNCIGQNLAMHEMRIILATLLYNFDIELVNPNEKWLKQKASALWIKTPLMCRLKAVSR